MARARLLRGGGRLTKVVVTGAGGYVGGRLIGALSGRRWEAHALVRERVAHLDVEQSTVDLARDADAVATLCKGAGALVHLAGENEVLAARDPAAAMASTVATSQRVAEAAATAGVGRLVYMSTVHVYGERMREGALVSEELRPEPRSPYAIARLASEHALAAATRSGPELVVLRLTNSVGAPAHPSVDRWSLVANDLCRQGALFGRLELRSSGVQWRDFVALRDVCEIVAAACRDLAPGTYNLGSGTPIRVRDLAGLIQDAFELRTGSRPELRAPEPGPSRPQPYRVSVERLAAHGLSAETPLEDAIAESVDFCLEHREILERWARSTT